MSKVVVTGGAGFIGSHLVEALRKRGDTVIFYDNLSRGKESLRNLKEIGRRGFILGDILDLEKLKTVIKDGIDVVFHLAALPSHRLALLRPYDYLNIDLMGTANVLEAARLCKKPPLVVMASSNKVYGKQACPWRESKLPQPEGPYAVAKWASEKMCEMYTKYFEVPTVVLRYHHVAGPRSNSDLALSIFVESALNDKAIMVHGKFDKHADFDSCKANYTHVADAVRATLIAAKKYKGFNIYNIANGKTIEVKYMAEYVIKTLAAHSSLNLVVMDKHETLDHISDVSKAKNELGFTAKFPVEKAMVDYINWRIMQI